MEQTQLPDTLVDMGQLSKKFVRLDKSSLVGTAVATNLMFQCLFLSDTPVSTRLVFISSIALQVVHRMSKNEIVDHLRRNNIGYYCFDGQDSVRPLICINHLGRIFCKPSPDEKIYRFRIFSRARFMLLFPENSFRGNFRKLKELPRTIYVDNSGVGSLVAEQNFGSLTEATGNLLIDNQEAGFRAFGIVPYDRMREALHAIAKHAYPIIITSLACRGSEEVKFIERVHEISSKCHPRPVVVSYLRRVSRVRPRCDAAFLPIFYQDMSLRNLFYAYVLYYNREVLKSSLDVSSF